MLFTSGTTTRPKGVLLTHANFLYIGEICARSVAVTPGDRYLLVLPLFHVNAQCISYFPCLTAGASIVICEQFSARAFSTLRRRQQRPDHAYQWPRCSCLVASVPVWHPIRSAQIAIDRPAPSAPHRPAGSFLGGLRTPAHERVQCS